MKCYGIVTKVTPGSIAEELEIQPGDRLIKVNDEEIHDIIDLSFALSDEYIELLIEKADGEQELLEIEKDYDEDLGIEFESAVFDGIRRCANKCIFCFVDQMPEGMRESLYVKDDDYRMSFLYGNFITLTNLGAKELDRIRRLHLSPLYVSVQATTPEVRTMMLNNKRAGQIVEQLKTLTETGIELHTQVVLCPGINDGEVLDKTISDLYDLAPEVLSIAIVPVGLTAKRDKLYPLKVFTTEQAIGIIEQVTKWQEKCRKELNKTFVYLADEFYVMANMPIPPYEFYDNFPQLENGVGLVRSFLEDWKSAAAEPAKYQEHHYIDVVCSVSSEKILRPLFQELCIPNLTIRVVLVRNSYFGPDITVTGLLTGQDILKALQETPGPRTSVIIPGVALRKGERVFLDNMVPQDIQEQLNVPVRIAYNACDLKELLYNWR